MLTKNAKSDGQNPLLRLYAVRGRSGARACTAADAAGRARRS